MLWKLEEKEKTDITGEVTKALNEYFELFNRLSKQHFAEGSDEESESEDVEMETDSRSKGEKLDADRIIYFSLLFCLDLCAVKCLRPFFPGTL